MYNILLYMTNFASLIYVKVNFVFVKEDRHYIHTRPCRHFLLPYCESKVMKVYLGKSSRDSNISSQKILLNNYRAALELSSCLSYPPFDHFVFWLLNLWILWEAIYIYIYICGDIPKSI